jgi:two-component system response regulator FixJ
MQSPSLVHVIDDDDAVRQSLAFVLQTARMAVRTYESANAFMSALPGIEPGCIVTDVRMPGMSGIDLLRRLNELKIGMPVIVITGHGDVQLAVEAMKVGRGRFHRESRSTTRCCSPPSGRRSASGRRAFTRMRNTRS